MLPSGRNPAIDALRTFAVLGMMAAHTSRLIVINVRPEWSYWVLTLEPLIPSLFLFLAGVSLTYSIAKSENANLWYKRQAKRALGLWLISALFFALEEGIRLPDVFVASGILCTISYAILSLGALLLIPGSIWILGLVLGLGTLAFTAINSAGVQIFPLVSGNSPLFPLLLFAAAGAFWGLAMRRVPRLTSWIGLPALLIAIGLIHLHGWETLFTYPIGRSDATRVLAQPLTGGVEKSVAYYNLRPVLALFCVCVHLSCMGVLQVLSRLKDSWNSRLFILGRNALEVYVLHLALLAILVVSFGFHPLKTAWQGSWVLAWVITICLIWSNWREKRKNRLYINESR